MWGSGGGLILWWISRRADTAKSEFSETTRKRLAYGLVDKIWLGSTWRDIV